MAAVAKDRDGNLWVYWGTGDKLDPTAANAQEKIFAVKDTDWTSTRTISNLQNISSEGSVYNDSSAYGYYINLTGQGEKVLADLAVFGGVLYVTTFTPQSSTDPCYRGGTAKLYGVNFTTGGGALVIEGEHRSPTPQHRYRNGDTVRPDHFAAAHDRHSGPVRHDQRQRQYQRPDSAGGHQPPRFGESHQFALLERQARGVITRLSRRCEGEARQHPC